jgi:hypothetical protein
VLKGTTAGAHAGTTLGCDADLQAAEYLT